MFSIRLKKFLFSSAVMNSVNISFKITLCFFKAMKYSDLIKTKTTLALCLNLKVNIQVHNLCW